MRQFRALGSIGPSESFRKDSQIEAQLEAPQLDIVRFPQLPAAGSLLEEGLGILSSMAAATRKPGTTECCVQPVRYRLEQEEKREGI